MSWRIHDPVRRVAAFPDRDRPVEEDIAALAGEIQAHRLPAGRHGGPGRALVGGIYDLLAVSPAMASDPGFPRYYSSSGAAEERMTKQLAQAALTMVLAAAAL